MFSNLLIKHLWCIFQCFIIVSDVYQSNPTRCPTTESLLVTYLKYVSDTYVKKYRILPTSCWWQNRPNQRGQWPLVTIIQNLLTSRNICVTMLDHAVLTKKTIQFQVLSALQKFWKQCNTNSSIFPWRLLNESFRNFFGVADCPNSDIFLIERMTHLEHNEENFTFFIISENKWIMKYKLINFIYFKKLNLTSKVGLWTVAKSRLRVDGPQSPEKVRDESEFGIKSNSC